VNQTAVAHLEHPARRFRMALSTVTGLSRWRPAGLPADGHGFSPLVAIRGVAAQHGELVAQDEDLQVLGGVTAGEQGEQLDGAAQHE